MIRLVFIETTGVDITRLYKDLYKLKKLNYNLCLGMIKYMVVRVVKIPRKFVIMDEVIVDVPPMVCCCLGIGESL